MIKRILNNAFFKSILTLSTGSLVAQLVKLLASPLMTRLYTADEIGTYTLIMTIVNMCAGVVAGQYDMSIVSEEKESNVMALVQLSMVVSIITSFFVSIVYSYYLKLQNNFSFVLSFIIVFVLLLLSGITLIITSYNNREKNYKLISGSSVGQSLIKEVTLVIMGFLNFGYIGLLTSELLGKIEAIRYQKSSLRTKFNSFKVIDKHNLIQLAKKYKKQPFFSVPALFASNFSYTSINLFVEYLYGTTILGYYSISFAVLGMPLGLISGNVSKVYLKEASNEFRTKNNYKTIFLRTSLLLLTIALPMVFFLIAFAPTLFKIMFGPTWEVAGMYVQILAPMFGIRMIVSPLTSGILVSGKQHIGMLIQFIFVVASIVSFLLVKILNLSVEKYLFIISGAFTLLYLIYFFILYKLSKSENSKGFI